MQSNGGNISLDERVNLVSGVSCLVQQGRDWCSLYRSTGIFEDLWEIKRSLSTWAAHLQMFP
jgi:hypothetical protein